LQPSDPEADGNGYKPKAGKPIENSTRHSLGIYPISWRQVLFDCNG
jgi:hypothetical protein